MATRTEESERRRERRRDFADALRDVLEAKNLTHRQLADLCGWAGHQKIYPWLEATAEPAPDTVFEIERALRLRPGALSLKLGYAPPEALKAQPLADFNAVVDADPALEDRAKDLLKQTYATLIRRPRKRA